MFALDLWIIGIVERLGIWNFLFYQIDKHKILEYIIFDNVY